MQRNESLISSSGNAKDPWPSRGRRDIPFQWRVGRTAPDAGAQGGCARFCCVSGGPCGRAGSFPKHLLAVKLRKMHLLSPFSGMLRGLVEGYLEGNKEILETDIV